MTNQNGLDDILKEFLVEASENLDTLDQDLVILESNPKDQEVLNRIFRTIHSIKGTSGFFGLTKLESVAHLGENLLDGLRSNKLELNAEITNVLLQLVDSIREIFSYVGKGQGEGPTSYEALIEKLKKITSSLPTKITTPEVSLEGAAPETASEMVGVLEVNLPTPPAASPVEQKIDIKAENTPSPKGEPSRNSAAPEVEAKSGHSLAETTLRVDVHLIDELMNLVGELVLARNQILQFSRGLNDSGLLGSTQRLNSITSELQESVMRTRMQPIDNVWSKFPRVIRDVAQLCKKEARIEMEGKDTELDKTIIEAIKDPLTHIIRNSVDHGLEMPDIRKARGKDPVGTVKLKARHEGGYVVIDIADDGAGLNLEKIKAKASEKGLITPEQSQKMSDREAAKLIFAPGFSTADQITNISGRGVGMDVVRSNIEKIGGVVDVLTVSNQGTTVRIRIPLTLAIIPALIVMCAGRKFAIPQVSLVELVRIPAEKVGSEIEKIGEASFYRLRGQLMPLIHLGETLKIAQFEEIKAGSSLNIIFVQVEGRQFGIVVDSVSDTEEIVVKPLSKQLKNVSIYAGAAIMGDGKISLILDVAGVAKHSGLFSAKDGKIDNQEEVKLTENSKTLKQRLLIVDAGHGSRVAIPVEKLNRLEEFAVDSFEYAAGHLCTQYRGEILPLVDIVEFLGKEAPVRSGDVKAVIIKNQNIQLGLLVNGILDIVEENIALTKISSGKRIVGSAIVAGAVTDFINLDDLISVVEGVRSEGTNFGVV
jgi:two-component system chemotaxis sensor kinase CheA